MRSRSLSDTYPELAAQAVDWDPATVSFGSTKRMLWRCERGHEWWATVNNRSTGTGCPFCAGHRVIAGMTDLATTHPHLAKEALGWDARLVSAGSHKRVWWRCKESHEWQALVSQRAKVSGSDCPFCANQRVLVGYNDLATSNPQLAKQACGWNPTTVTAGSNRKVRWRCEKGHEWVTTPNKRSSGRGCPVCAGSQVLAGFNDLVTMHPALAGEVVVGNPDEVSAGSNKKLRWRCEKGHEWDASAKDRSKGRGCPICAGKEVLQGFNDLMTTNPLLAAEAAGWDPRTISAGSGKRVRWRCAVDTSGSLSWAVVTDVPFALARRSSTVSTTSRQSALISLSRQTGGTRQQSQRVADGSFHGDAPWTTSGQPLLEIG